MASIFTDIMDNIMYILVIAWIAVSWANGSFDDIIKAWSELDNNSTTVDANSTTVDANSTTVDANSTTRITSNYNYSYSKCYGGSKNVIL